MMTMGDLSGSTARHGFWKIQPEYSLQNCLKILGLERVCRGFVGLVRETQARQQTVRNTDETRHRRCSVGSR